MLSFACTECARCCSSLVDKKAIGLPANADTLAEGGFYALPRMGGLQLWSWERRRLLAAAAAMGQPLHFEPALGVVDETRGTFVTLIWELVADACPMLRGKHCGAYEARPTICRAYPLLVQGRHVVVSSFCPGAVYTEEPLDMEAYLYQAYPGCIEAVSVGARLPRFTANLLAFLESAGVVRLVRGQPVAFAEEARRRGVVDLMDLLEDAGVLTQAGVEERLAGLGAQVRAELAAKYAAG